MFLFCFCQYDRARTIYQYGLDRIPKEKAKELFDAYTSFEKRFGDRKGVDSVILSKREFQYEKEVSYSVSCEIVALILVVF